MYTLSLEMTVLPGVMERVAQGFDWTCVITFQHKDVISERVDLFTTSNTTKVLQH